MTSGRFTPAAAMRTSTSPSAGFGVGRRASLSCSGPPGAAISITVIWSGIFAMRRCYTNQAGISDAPAPRSRSPASSCMIVEYRIAKAALMTTAYITHADCLRHEMGAGHPENPERLSSVNEHMRSSGLLEQLRCLEAPLAEARDIKRVHTPAYVDLIFDNAPREGYAQLDPDTAMNPYSLAAARRAAGAGLLAVDEVMAGRSVNAFCAVRPCGHHATQARSMGFCIFNNVGVAAAYAIEKKGLERVAIIDFDVHHGNGTEDMFSVPQWRDRVLMASFFQHPFYPYSGTVNPAPNMINVPLAEGSGGA